MTLMQTKTTADFKFNKSNAECIYKFNILLYCEQKCYRKDCSADFYSATILSEVSERMRKSKKLLILHLSRFIRQVSQSQKTLIIDIVKPNSGINEEFNYKQSIKPLDLLLYVGSTLSLWFGISVYGLSVYLEKYLGKFDQRSSSKESLLKRTRRILKRPFKVRSARTMSNYRTVNVLEGTKFRERLCVNYRQNIDLNYMQNIGLYSGDQLYKV